MQLALHWYPRLRSHQAALNPLSQVCIGLVLFGAVPNSVTVPVGYSFIGGGACINYFASFAVAFIDPSRFVRCLPGHPAHLHRHPAHLHRHPVHLHGRPVYLHGHHTRL